MKYAETKREKQQLYRVVNRLEPESNASDLLAEELASYDLNDITKPASEKRAPENRGYSAVTEHGERLAHTRFKFELFQCDSRTDQHDKSVACVREHHSEEKIIEK